MSPIKCTLNVIYVGSVASGKFLSPFTEGARMEERVVNQSVAVGEHLTLRCPARGDLPLSFTWAKDGVTLTGGGDMEVRQEEGGRTSMLVLASTLRSQAGIYTCHAANRYGSDSATFFLNVVGECVLCFAFGSEKVDVGV